MIVLDTNVVLRIGTEMNTDELSPSAVDFVLDAQKRGEAAISAATIWEIGELADKGNLRANLDMFQVWAREARIAIIPIDANIAAHAVRLRSEWGNGDPADRFIMATSLLTGSPLVTSDADMVDWDGLVQVVDARAR